MKPKQFEIIASNSNPESELMQDVQTKAGEKIKISSKLVGKPKVSGQAYSGGLLRQWWSQYPIVVDLKGMSLPDSVPLLINHANHPIERIGKVKPTTDFKTLQMSGKILSKSDDAKEIIEQGKEEDGDWELSIRAPVQAQELIAEGVKVTVNDQQFIGPIIQITESILREISVVAVGEDLGTNMEVAAKLNQPLINQQPKKGAPQMNPQLRKFIIAKFKLDANADDATVLAHLNTIGLTVDNVKAMMPDDQANQQVEANIAAAGVDIQSSTPNQEPEIKASNKPATIPFDQVKAAVQQEMQAEHKVESERRQSIIATCDGDFPDLQAKAIAENWTPEQTNKEVLAAMRGQRPNSEFGIIVKSQLTGADQQNMLEAALSLRAGFSGDDLLKSLGDKSVEAGDKCRDMPLRELFVQCSMMEGITLPTRGDNDIIRAGFSSVSLPGILNNVANKAMLKAYEAQSVIAVQLCSAGDLNNFKESERYRLTDIGDLELVPADGELKHGGAGEEGAKNQLHTYGKLFILTRKHIIDDDLGAFLKIPKNMGNRAARKVDQLFFVRLMSNPTQSDTKALFSTDHKNYFGGATSALSEISLSKGIQMFGDQVDSDDQPISVEPKFLLTCPTLKRTAKELTKSPFFISGADTRMPMLNSIVDDDLSVVSAPYLSNTKYTNYSETAWYLFGDPNQVDTFEIGYLKGQRTPTVEQGKADFNTLGMAFRVYFDIGVREQDHRGMIMSKGKA
jgi:Mu-like prophage major head subunit gpT